MLGRHGQLTAWTLTALLVVAPVLALNGTANEPVYDVCATDCPHDSIQDAVDAASPGDTINVGPGTYTEAVTVLTEGISIVGAGEGVTIMDGTGIPFDGIFVPVPNVSVSHLTVQNFGGNGVFYSDTSGFHVDHVTALDNGPYGIYAIRSTDGLVANSYASGHADSGFYIGEVDDCRCTLINLIAEDNLIGYSGTGAGGVDILDSVWRNNAAGIVPNVLPQEPELQDDLHVEGNLVENNNNREANQKWHFSGFVHVPDGLGVVIAGGIEDTVIDNTILDHDLAGVALVWLFTQPSFNEVRGNVIDGDGVGILWDEGGVNNCFEENVDLDGNPASFSAGPVWSALGSLPDCDTPNANSPSPVALSRIGSMLVFNCEPWDLYGDVDLMDGEGCHYHG